MIATKMENGINKINNFNIKFCLLIIFFLFTSLNLAHSSTNPWDCLLKDKELTKIDFEKIIEETEQFLPIWEKAKKFEYLLSDLSALQHCYRNINEDKKFFLKFEELIDKKIISKNTYINWKDEKVFSKKEWIELFRKYVFAKQDYAYDINKKKDVPIHNQFPKNQIDWKYIKIIFDILNSEKEKSQ